LRLNPNLEVETLRCPYCGYEGKDSEFVKEEKKTLKFKAFRLIPIPMPYHATILVCPSCGKLLEIHCFKPSRKLYRLLK